MLRLQIDPHKTEACRSYAESIAQDVQSFIDAHTTVGVERTVARALGVSGVNEEGTPLCNLLVDKLQTQGLLQDGVARFLAQVCAEGAPDVQAAAESLVFSRQPMERNDAFTADHTREVLSPYTRQAIQKLEAVRNERDRFQEKFAHASSQPGTPLKYVIVATGNIFDDALQAQGAASSGADIVAVIRATAQSLLDYVPEGTTTEGYGGTFATQANFRVIRQALDEVSEKLGRYVMQCNYSSGLCMSEIAWLGAIERLDMLLNDSMYGILFRDINMCRTFVDQYFSRRIIAKAGIVINTGEDNYLTTADAVEAAHTVLASQFINEAFGHRAGLKDEQLGLGHAYEIDPWLENSFLIELSQALLVRQIFPKHPIKWMPPTKHKTGDIFHSHVHDAMFNMAGIATQQSIQLLGMFSEAVHNPLLMDRHLSLKSARYIFGAARSLSDELIIEPNGLMAQRAQQVLEKAEALLHEVSEKTIWAAIESGMFADVKRSRAGGKGLAGVIEKSHAYVNPILEALE